MFRQCRFLPWHGGLEWMMCPLPILSPPSFPKISSEGISVNNFKNWITSSSSSKIANNHTRLSYPHLTTLPLQPYCPSFPIARGNQRSRQREQMCCLMATIQLQKIVRYRCFTDLKLIILIA